MTKDLHNKSMMRLIIVSMTLEKSMLAYNTLSVSQNSSGMKKSQINEESAFYFNFQLCKYLG